MIQFVSLVPGRFYSNHFCALARLASENFTRHGSGCGVNHRYPVEPTVNFSELA